MSLKLLGCVNISTDGWTGQEGHLPLVEKEAADELKEWRSSRLCSRGQVRV